MIHRVKATINLKALSNNLEVARTHAKNRKIVAVIKANAYGHGLGPTAEALEAADVFAVTDVDEADQLRASGSNKAILILQGIIQRSDIQRIAENGYQVVIHNLEHVNWLEEELSKIKLAHPLTFWLKMNSGMGRLGITSDNFVSAYQNLQRKPWCQELILMTHLANANLRDSALNTQQLASFEAITKLIPDTAATSIAASSALLANFGENSDWVRPGIMLYGSSPFAFSDVPSRRESFGLQAVMTLEARLIAIQNCKAGDNVGYCSQFICPRDMRIGIVSIGYADGYPSNAPNGTPALINGKRTITTGRVSMDMLAIDLSPDPDARLGDSVTLWGDDLSLDEIAEHTGILSYNLTCSIANRVSREYKK